MSTPSLVVIQAVLRGHYTPPKPGDCLYEGKELISMLAQLPALSLDEHIDPILVQIQKHHSGTTLRGNDYAIIAYVDDCITQVLKQTDLDFKIEAFIRDLAPHVALLAIRQDAHALFQAQTILKLIDSLIRECVGWSEDLGILGDQFMVKTTAIINNFIVNRIKLDQCETELQEFFTKEHAVYTKMETRLCESQAGEPLSSAIASNSAVISAIQCSTESVSNSKLSANCWILPGNLFIDE